MSKKFNTKNKFRYFIICNSFMALMFDASGQGYWINRQNKNAQTISTNQFMVAESDCKISEITVGQFKYFKALEVNRRNFLKFSRSKYNKTN